MIECYQLLQSAAVEFSTFDPKQLGEFLAASSPHSDDMAIMTLSDSSRGLKLTHDTVRVRVSYVVAAVAHTCR